MGSSDNSKAIERQAEQERLRYEAQIRAQREAALLEGSKSSDAIAKVEVGSNTDYNFGGDDYTSKRRRTASGGSTSTSLGIK